MFWLEMRYVGHSDSGSVFRMPDAKSETRNDFTRLPCRFICTRWYSGCSLKLVCVGSTNCAVWSLMDVRFEH